MKRWRFANFLFAALLSLAFTAYGDDQPKSQPRVPTPTQQAATVKAASVTGTMDINYDTRTQLDTSGSLKPNSPAIGARDKYNLDLIVNQSIEFAGEIYRQPNLYTKFLAKPKQAAKLYYNVVINVINPNNPAQKKSVGKWVGTCPINTETGAYVLDGGNNEQSPLRFDVDSVGRITAFKDNFTGNLVGKSEKKDTLAAYTFKRILPNGQTVEKKIEHSDPMKFESVKIAHGPSDNYQSATVNGRLDYDRETGNYFTDGLRIGNSDGTEDVITGSIKWVEDPKRKENGKGHYEFNLRWNEAKSKPKGGEAAAFQPAAGEDAFFSVDPNMASLTGTIDYLDKFDGSQVKDADGNPQPSTSKLTYNLQGQGLSKEQVMAFTKVWLVAIGPTNDE